MNTPNLNTATDTVAYIVNRYPNKTTYARHCWAMYWNGNHYTSKAMTDLVALAEELGIDDPRIVWQISYHVIGK